MSDTNHSIDSPLPHDDANSNNNTMNDDNNNQGIPIRSTQQLPFQFDLSFLPKLDQLLPENPLFFMQQHFQQQQQHQQQQQQQHQHQHQHQSLEDQPMKDINTVSGLAEPSTGNHPPHTLMTPFDQSTNNGSEPNQSIWSGFNNFFSNVAHNPFPQSIPNLAKNVSEYFSNYQLFSSLNPQSETNHQGGSAQIQSSAPGIKYESMVDGTFKPSSMNSQGMQIRVLGVPQTGAKSRVETQIKLCIQLVTDDGDKAQQWSHLKLPEHMVAKDKLKRQMQITVDTDNNGSITSVNGLDNTSLPVKAEKMLFLSARVICASDPSRKVVTCLGCIQRERKRSQRRKENKIKTENDDDKRPEDEQSLALEEQKVLLFNCSEIVDFSSGDTILPTRITCYCRHHNERLGFCIYFEMQDHTGKPVATGMSPPIMITDDHKSSKIKAGRKRPRTDLDKPISTQAILSANSFPFAPTNNNNNGNAISPQSSSSNTSPSSTTQSFLPFNSFTDTPFNNNNSAHSISQHRTTTQNAGTNGASPSSSSSSPNHTALTNHPHHQTIKSEPSHMQLDQNLLNSLAAVTAVSRGSPNNNNNNNNNGKLQPTAQGKAAMVVERPQMQRMIPNEGPMDGGIEVTILGAGFRPGLTCMFGDVAATNTHYWSPNTLVCILPPATEPGAVVVSFKEFPVVADSQDLTLFTYCNENDRALMELALQVVGLKMTGKVEDARDIAMRIVEGNGNQVVGDTSRQRRQPQQRPQQQQLSGMDTIRPVDVIKQLLEDRSSQSKPFFDWPLIQMLDTPSPWSE